MGLKCLSISTALIAVATYYIYWSYFAPLPPPKIDTTKYWGPSSLAKQVEKSDVLPFKIDNYGDVITKLQNRLNEPLNLVKPLENVGFRYGFNKQTLEKLIKYWRDDYLPRWPERLRYLNGMSQFTTKIQGFVIFAVLLFECHLFLSGNSLRAFDNYINISN